MLALSKALNCLACRWLDQPVSVWQVEMGWSGRHRLARDQGGLVAAISNVNEWVFLETPRAL
jgi:hypothetical protein